jgi:hypothetical protein
MKEKTEVNIKSFYSEMTKNFPDSETQSGDNIDRYLEFTTEKLTSLITVF